MSKPLNLSPKAGAELLASAVKTENLDAMHRLLFDDKVDPNAMHNAGTMLHLAAQLEHDRALSMLLEARADVHKPDGQGHSVLRAAIKVGSGVSVKKLLAAGADPSAEGEENGRNVTDAEVSRQHGNEVAAPVNQALPRFLVNRAVREKNAEWLEALLNSGETPDTFDRFGKTALMEAAENGFVEGIKLLLQYKADTELKTKDGRTAMHLAAAGKSADAVEALYDGGAKMRVRDAGDHLPLDIANREGGGSVVIAVRKYLMREDADFAMKASRLTKDVDAPAKAIFKKRTALKP